MVKIRHLEFHSCLETMCNFSSFSSSMVMEFEMFRISILEILIVFMIIYEYDSYKIFSNVKIMQAIY